MECHRQQGGRGASSSPRSRWQQATLRGQALQSHLAERGGKGPGRRLGCWEFPNWGPGAGKAAFDGTSRGFVRNSNEWHAEVKILISYFSKATLMEASSQYKQW